MDKKKKSAVQATQDELIGILTAISIVAKRLAENLAKLEETQKAEVQNYAR